MTKKQSNQLTLSCRPWIVRLTPEVIKFLSVPTKFGSSRLKAYLWLLQSASATTTPYKPAYGRPFNLEAGQLVVSITETAEQWKWARETVRKFFDRLESFKMLTKEQLDRCSLITMDMEWQDSGCESIFSAPFPVFVMPKQVPDKMQEWLYGNIADEELLEAIDEAADDFDSADDYVSSHQFIIMQYSLIRQLIKQWSADGTDIPEVPDEPSRELLFRLFHSCLSGNWIQWLRLLKSYSPGLSAYGTTGSAINEPTFISNGRVILDSLFIHLNVDLGRKRL